MYCPVGAAATVAASAAAAGDCGGGAAATVAAVAAAAVAASAAAAGDCGGGGACIPIQALVIAASFFRILTHYQRSGSHYGGGGLPPVQYSQLSQIDDSL